MKKNVMMRAASALLVLVLLTTCVISGTFAKYTTGATGSDEARVAKFGVTITANGSMFSKNYEDAANGNGVATTAKGSVDSSNADKIFAPGTKGTMASVALEGTPEVKVQVAYSGTVTLNGKWKAKLSATDTAETYYCPLKIKVGNDTLYGLDYSSEAEFKKAIEDKINASVTTQTYNAGTDLATIKTDSFAISWEWEFEGSKGAKIERTDYADTYLGNATDKGDIQIAITTTVTQID